MVAFLMCSVFNILSIKRSDAPGALLVIFSNNQMLPIRDRTKPEARGASM